METMTEISKKSRNFSMWQIILASISILSIFVFFMFYPPLPRPPEIGRHLPSNFSEGENVFLERVKSHFPAQSNEDDMVYELKNQGFTVNIDTKEAYFSKSSFPCKLQWRINWLAESGLITSVGASYGGICL